MFLPPRISIDTPVQMNQPVTDELMKLHQRVVNTYASQHAGARASTQSTTGSTIAKYDNLGSPIMHTPQKSSATARLMELEAQLERSARQLARCKAESIPIKEVAAMCDDELTLQREALQSQATTHLAAVRRQCQEEVLAVRAACKESETALLARTAAEKRRLTESARRAMQEAKVRHEADAHARHEHTLLVARREKHDALQSLQRQTVEARLSLVTVEATMQQRLDRLKAQLQLSEARLGRALTDGRCQSVGATANQLALRKQDMALAEARREMASMTATADRLEAKVALQLEQIGHTAQQQREKSQSEAQLLEQRRQNMARNEAMVQIEIELQRRLDASEAECARMRQLHDAQRASDSHKYEAELASERRRYQKLEQRHRLKLATLVQHFEADRRQAVQRQARVQVLLADDFGTSPERSPADSSTAVASTLSPEPAVLGGSSALQLRGLVAMQEDVIQQSKAENIDAQRELEHLRRLHAQHHSTATEIALINRALRRELQDAHDVLQTPVSPAIHALGDPREVARTLFGDDPHSVSPHNSSANRLALNSEVGPTEEDASQQPDYTADSILQSPQPRPHIVAQTVDDATQNERADAVQDLPDRRVCITPTARTSGDEDLAAWSIARARSVVAAALEAEDAPRGDEKAEPQPTHTDSP